MRKTCRTTVLAFLVALGALMTAGSAAANTYDDDSGKSFQNGNCLDLGVSRADGETTGGCGGWNQTTPSINGRPYVKYLAVTNGGTTTVIIDNTDGDASPLALSGSDVYAVVSPTNSCRPNQTPEAGVCYLIPNRVTVSLVHETSANNWSYDFTTSSSSTPSVTSDSVIDLIVGIRSTYSTLRWSWVNGIPNYWSTTTPVSPTAGDAHVKFTPKTMPVMTSGGCSQIPVSTCDIARADREVLQPNLLLSMDTTLDVGLAGVLFGTSSAFIGSLETTPIQAGSAPTLTYAAAAPHLNADGTLRTGNFYALLPSNILTLFGTSVAAFDPAILAIARTGDTGTFSTAWAPWTAAGNGSDGQFLTISNISFSAPKFRVTRASALASTTQKGSKAPSVKVGKTVSFAAIASGYSLKTSGSKLSAKVSTPKICKVVGKAIKGLKAGTCKGTLMVTPKKGKPSKKKFSLAVVGGKQLMFALHRR